MDDFQKLYTLAWLIASLSCVCIWLFKIEPFILFSKDYWRFLLRPWKVVTFIITTLFMVLIAPYSGDYTWDYFDGFFMSALTYMTAPWAVGVFFKFFKRQASVRQIFLAFCLWMFSASWSYDLYLVIRDGHYPLTWLPNLFASSILYWSAGLFWNLDWNPKKGVFYAFTQYQWFNYSKGTVFIKILQRGWMFVLVAMLILGGVVISLNLH